MERKLKAAVIGLGTICWGHLDAYRDNEHTELYAVCDIDGEWAEYVRNKYNAVKAYSDYHELLRDPEIDLVSICLPNKWHAPVTIEALDCSKHVLCEKPMAPTAADGRKMREAELRSGKKLMISHNQRFGEDVQIMKKLYEDGAFGDVYHVRIGWRRPLGHMQSPYSERENGTKYNRNWFHEKSEHGGVLRDLGSHLIDLTMHILGFPKLESAYASAYRKFKPALPEGEEEKFVFDSEDLITGVAKFEGGLSIQMEFSFGSTVPEQKLITNIYGTRMGAERLGFSKQLNLIRVGEGDTFTTELAKPEDFGAEPFKHPAHGFIDAIVNDTEVPVPSDQGIKVLEILDALYAECGI